MKKLSKKYYCYILRCKDGTLYTGITDDLIKREKAHNNGSGSKYVHSRGGGTMVYSEIFKTKPKALQREAAIKKFSRQKKRIVNRNKISF
jgi:putative endonuclease